jgi:hypothetical protein
MNASYLIQDISEKDFELTKNGFKLFLVVYAIKHIKSNVIDKHASISRVFAGGGWCFFSQNGSSFLR